MSSTSSTTSSSSKSPSSYQDSSRIVFDGRLGVDAMMDKLQALTRQSVVLGESSDLLASSRRIDIPKEFHLRNLQLNQTPSASSTNAHVSILRALVDVFRYCSKHYILLNTLVIDSCMPLLEVEVLCWEVSRSALVRNLVLVGTLFTRETTSVLLETLAHNPRLQSLTLSHAPIDKEAAHYLKELLAGASTSSVRLESLRLMDVQIQDDYDHEGDVGARDASQDPTSDNGVSTAAWKIATGLKENLSLQELEFYQCHVSDLNLAAIMEALEGHPQMRQLTLQTNLGPTTLSIVDQLLSSPNCHITALAIVNENHIDQSDKDQKWKNKQEMLKNVRHRVQRNVRRILNGVQHNGAVVSRTVVHQIQRCRVDNTLG